MCGKITVVDRRAKGSNGAIYIGRGGRGVAGSPLANPRRLNAPKPGGGRWERGVTLVLYERELRAALDRTVAVTYWGEDDDGTPWILTDVERERMRGEMNRLYKLVAAGGDVELDCFCKRHGANVACHGDVIRKLLIEALRTRGIVYRWAA
jgi:hypothetical protein